MTALSLEERLALDDLYNDYVTGLDGGAYEDWARLFLEDAYYDIIPRSNYDRGYEIGIMRCESRGMIEDRIHAIRETIMHEPRICRHFLSGLRYSRHANGADAYDVTGSYLVVETLPDNFTRILSAGAYIDEVVRTDEGLRFRKKRCVYDSELIPNSIVFPL